MGYNERPEARRERTRAERLTEGLTVAVASVLSFVLLVGPAYIFVAIAWQSVTETGTTTFSRFVAPVICVALVASPPVLARVVFLSGRRKGKERLTAAVPATLTLLGLSVVPFAALCLIVVYGD
ncbi:hypothetical protein ACIO1C_32595 [Streptomyces sp. NPDC087420]|uniref:hypothetical protein n=1 Tax=Streptomyces sp. NPDC087420 TaxID=3365785 RepID=UPI003834CCD4